MKWLVWVVFAVAVLAAEEDLGVMVVEGDASQRTPQTEGFSEVFSAPEYIEQRSYLPEAAAQKTVDDRRGDVHSRRAGRSAQGA